MVAAIILLVGLVLVMSLPIFSRVSTGSPLANDISEVRNLVLAVRSFAYDSDGRYPELLEILHPDYIDDPSLFTTNNTASGKIEPYIYLNGVSATADPRTPLIISPPLPPPHKDRRVVGFVGGNTALIKMTTAQVEAARQGKLPPK